MILNKRKQKENPSIEFTENGKTKKLDLQISIKVLGIRIDNELNWNIQVHAVNKKAKLAARNLNRINNLVPTKSAIMLYNSLVATHFNYANTVWSGCGSKNRNKLQRTQNSAVKSLLGRSKQDSTKDALKDANLLPLQEKR